MENRVGGGATGGERGGDAGCGYCSSCLECLGCIKDFLYHTKYYRTAKNDFETAGETKELRTYLKDFWTTLAVVNALLIASSVTPFTQYAPMVMPGAEDDAGRWRAIVLFWLWATVLMVNCIALTITTESLGFLLATPPTDGEVKSYSEHHIGSLGAPIFWTLLGTALFLLALEVHFIVIIITTSGLVIGFSIASLFLLFFAGLAAGVCIWWRHVGPPCPKALTREPRRDPTVSTLASSQAELKCDVDRSEPSPSSAALPTPQEMDRYYALRVEGRAT